MKDGKIAVAIYARLSVDRDGKKVGIDTQLQDSRRLVKERGWVVADEYVDRNLTAADKLVARPEYDRLVRDYHAGRFSGLVCWDLDRLTRQPRQLEDWIDAAESARSLSVVTANGEADLTTDGGRLYARLKVAVAKGETERASARQKRSKQARRETGKWHGGIPPYGYSARNGELLPASAEVSRIKEAAKRLLDDREPMHSIVTDWNNKGVRTRSGKHWRQANLRSILLNRSMLGETKAGVVGWDPIIDARTFDRLTALLSDPSRKVVHSPGVKGGKHSMGGGLSVCAKCGKPLVTNTKTNANGPTLGCLARVHGPDARNHPRVKREVTRKGEKVVVEQDTGRVTIGHDRLERYVFDVVTKALSQSDRWQTRMGESDPADDAKIDALEAERAALRDEKDRVKRAFIAGIIETEREALAEFERIDAALDAIEGQINGLLGRPVIANALADGVDWQTWTPGRRRAFLKLLLDAVIVDSWPEGMPRTRPRFRNESAEDYAVAREASMNEATARRVRIVTKWGVTI